VAHQAERRTPKYLVFMEENQEVVSWGIPVTSLHETDSVVWQRNNLPPDLAARR
jgi:hypothetical protein